MNVNSSRTRGSFYFNSWTFHEIRSYHLPVGRPLFLSAPRSFVFVESMEPELRDLLAGVNPEALTILADNDICSVDDAKMLTNTDLVNLGIKLGSRNKILKLLVPAFSPPSTSPASPPPPPPSSAPPAPATPAPLHEERHEERVATLHLNLIAPDTPPPLQEERVAKLQYEVTKLAKQLGIKDGLLLPPNDPVRRSGADTTRLIGPHLSPFVRHLVAKEDAHEAFVKAPLEWRECPMCEFRWLDKYRKDECPKCLSKLSKMMEIRAGGAKPQWNAGPVPTFKHPPGSAMIAEHGDCTAGGLHFFKYGKCLKCGICEGVALKREHARLKVTVDDSPSKPRLYRLSDSELEQPITRREYSVFDMPSSPNTPIASHGSPPQKRQAGARLNRSHWAPAATSSHHWRQGPAATKSDRDGPVGLAFYSASLMERKPDWRQPAMRYGPSPPRSPPTPAVNSRPKSAPTYMKPKSWKAQEPLPPGTSIFELTQSSGDRHLAVTVAGRLEQYSEEIFSPKTSPTRRARIWTSPWLR